MKYRFQGQEDQDELGLNWIQFKWRNHDPAIGRFFNIDPLAEDYSYQSPYNFAENRVIDGNELEGLEWVNATGAKIYNPNIKNDDGTRGAYTEHATRNDIKLGNTLRQTKTGLEQFNKLVNSKVEIQVNMSSGTHEKFPDAAGYTDIGAPGLYTDLSTGKVDGVELDKMEITLFTKIIGKLADAEKNGEVGSLFRVETNGLSFVEIMAAVLGHEIEHTTEDNVIKRASGEPQDKIEEKPTEVHRKIIEEQKEEE